MFPIVAVDLVIVLGMFLSVHLWAWVEFWWEAAYVIWDIKRRKWNLLWGNVSGTGNSSHEENGFCLEDMWLVVEIVVWVESITGCVLFMLNFAWDNVFGSVNRPSDSFWDFLMENVDMITTVEWNDMNLMFGCLGDNDIGYDMQETDFAWEMCALVEVVVWVESTTSTFFAGWILLEIMLLVG